MEAQGLICSSYKEEVWLEEASVYVAIMVMFLLFVAPLGGYEHQGQSQEEGEEEGACAFCLRVMMVYYCLVLEAEDGIELHDKTE